MFIVPFAGLVYQKIAGLKEQCVCFKLFKLEGKNYRNFQSVGSMFCRKTVGKTQGCRFGSSEGA
jgi:hypothetical protein